MKALGILRDKYTSLAFKELNRYNNGSAVKSLEIMNKLFKELEELNNRSCDNCEYDYIDVDDDNCQRCTRHFDDKYKAKE